MPTHPAPHAADLMRRLVAFDTTSRLSNLALIEFVRDYLADLGVTAELVHSADGAKANLFATLGRDDVGGIMLSGHTDVVPVDGQNWTSDPFDVALRDGRYVGRGTADMKGFIAIVLSRAPEILRRAGKTPIHIALSYDEEIGCVGVRRLLDELKHRPVKPRLAIVGEPTLMKPIVGHKGKTAMRCHVHGHECHSSLAHTGVNAVEAAAEIVAKLKEMARRLRRDGPFDADFTPSWTTVHTGRISGGTALNIVPKSCSFEFEIRHVLGVDAGALIEEVRRFARDVIEPEMKAVVASTGIAFEEISSYPALATPTEAEVTQLALSLSGANAVGRVSFGTEAGLFQAIDIPTVVCGPGSIDDAHKPDEFISVEQFRQGEAFIDRLIDRIAS